MAGELPWKLPNDLKFFKNTTWGMPVLMGRKTFESLGKKPLPGRTNIILTRHKGYDPGKLSVKVAGHLDEAVALARETDCRELFIAGGGDIYQYTMPFIQRIYLTRVHAEFPAADVFYGGFDEQQWNLRSALPFAADEKHAFAYTFQVWER